MNLKIGLDFDNTLVCYDRVFYDEALKRSLISKDTPLSKKAIRDAIRRSHDNQVWTELQAWVYSDGLKLASFSTGCEAFLKWLYEKQIPIAVISHKTCFAAIGDRIDLRTPAQQWIQSQEIFTDKYFGISIGKTLFFESTREEKINRIQKVGVTHFIDDLPEFLSEKSFPNNVKRILYNAHDLDGLSPDVLQYSNWNEIKTYFETCS